MPTVYIENAYNADKTIYHNIHLMDLFITTELITFQEHQNIIKM